VCYKDAKALAKMEKENGGVPERWESLDAITIIIFFLSWH
jgi:hypothetical protein